VEEDTTAQAAVRSKLRSMLMDTRRAMCTILIPNHKTTKRTQKESLVNLLVSMPDKLAVLAAALYITGEPGAASQEPTDTPGAVGSSQETADTRAALRAILQGRAVASSGGADTAAAAAASPGGGFAIAASRGGTRADTAAAAAAAACRSRLSAFICRIGIGEDPASVLLQCCSISFAYALSSSHSLIPHPFSLFTHSPPLALTHLLPTPFLYFPLCLSLFLAISVSLPKLGQ
jgi:hypothetical protein